MHEILQQADTQDAKAAEKGLTVPSRRFLPRTAAACFTSGVLAPIAGFTLIIAHAAIETDIRLGRWGTGLMIVAIPLLLLGSHLMDLDEKKTILQREHSVSARGPVPPAAGSRE